ncbi:MAG: glycosyltransferase family 4 protein [Candidatus Eisenbacteria bacterium]|nr:glycosyltransferase family 4 protein [Candidatus Eisenbacteria bacterium]
MKVAMVAQYPEDPERIPSGIAGVTVALVSALALLPDLEIEVVVPAAAVDAERTSRSGRIKVHHLPRSRRWGPGIGYAWISPRQVARKLSEIDHDIVHIQNWAHLVPHRGRPALLTIHGIQERDIAYRGRFRSVRSYVMGRLEARGRRRARNLIVINPYVAEVLGSTVGSRTWSIDNPVDDSFFEIRRAPVPGRILAVGRITPLKNVGGLIAAFARIARERPDAELSIVGGGLETAYGASCRNLAERLGIASRVRFLGLLSRAETMREAAAASCLAHCSFQENAPLAIAEAMAAGLPVVASRVGGIPYMVEDGLSGILVDPKSDASIAGALLRVIGGSDAEAMSRKARAVAEERFRSSTVASRTRAVYEEILAERNGGA